LPGKRLDNYTVKVYTLALLRLAKEEMRYRDIARVVGINIQQLARYNKGWCTPSLERAKHIIDKLEPIVGLKARVTKWMLSNDGIADAMELLRNPYVLYLSGYDCLMRFAGYRVTKVLALNGEDLMLATAVALRLMKPLVVATLSGDEYVTYVSGDEVKRLGVSNGSIGKRDSVLIVDAVIRRGVETDALVRLVRNIGAEVAGVYNLVCYKGVRVPEDVRVESVYRMG